MFYVARVSLVRGYEGVVLVVEVSSTSRKTPLFVTADHVPQANLVNELPYLADFGAERLK